MSSVVESWKRMPDGMDKREAYLRSVQESEARKRSARPATQAPQSRDYRPLWVVGIALVILAAWFMA